jgi:5-methylcytosine-specific restriction protein A
MKSSNRYPKHGTLNWFLEPGDSIRRTKLHEDYAGEQQGGIACSSLAPVVLLFSVVNRLADGANADLWSKEMHGYSDGWANSDRNLLYYMGQGTIGDQQADQRGNRAILNHIADGRDLRLFTPSSGEVNYVGRFICDQATPYQVVESPDRLGANRKVLLFRLIPMGRVAHELMPIINRVDSAIEY